MTSNATGTVAPGTPATTGPQGSVSAFDKMLAFLDTEDTGEGHAEAAADEEAETPPESAVSAEDELDAEAGAEDEGEESAESDEEAEGDEKPAGDTLYTVIVDGKEEQVTQSELLAGYSRQADYTRKTQALAEERKQLGSEKQTLVQERQEYAALLPKLRAMLEGDGQEEPNWEALRRADPVKAVLEKQRWDEKQARIATLRQEEERVTAAQAKEHEEQFKAFVREQRDLLLKRPETAHWADAEKRQADGAKIAATLLAAGFSEEELQIVDHRAMLIAYKAAQFDELNKAKSAAKQSVQEKIQRSPTVKAGAPAGKPKTAADRARSRLAKSGSKGDAESWFLATLT